MGRNAQKQVREHRPSKLNNRLAIPAGLVPNIQNSSGEREKFAGARVWRPEGKQQAGAHKNAPAKQPQQQKPREEVPSITLSAFRGAELSCADVLCTHHPEGDVTIQAVCVPGESAFGSYRLKLHRAMWRKERNPASEVAERGVAATDSVEPAVNPELLDGTHLALWTVFKCEKTSAIWFQKLRVGYHGELGRLEHGALHGRPEALTSAMPMIRGAYKPQQLELLAEWSGLEWNVNAQVKYAQYMTLPLGKFTELDAIYQEDLAALMDAAIPRFEDKVETFDSLIKHTAMAGGVSFEDGVSSEEGVEAEPITMVEPEALEAIRAQMPDAETFAKDGIRLVREDAAA